MAWDLRAALLKKEEFESARLMDFEFRERARTFRLVAEALGCDPAELAEQTVLKDDDAILAELATSHSITPDDLARLHGECRIAARAQLIGERGDPTPHRLG